MTLPDAYGKSRVTVEVTPRVEAESPIHFHSLRENSSRRLSESLDSSCSESSFLVVSSWWCEENAKQRWSLESRRFGLAEVLLTSGCHSRLRLCRPTRDLVLLRLSKFISGFAFISFSEGRKSDADVVVQQTIKNERGTPSVNSTYRLVVNSV